VKRLGHMSMASIDDVAPTKSLNMSVHIKEDTGESLSVLNQSVVNLKQEQRCVIAYFFKIQLPNTLPNILILPNYITN